MLRDAEKTIGNLIDKQRAAFISSVDEDGFPNTRAMLPPRKRVGIKTLYFSTSTSSAKVGQYRDSPKTCVYFCGRRFFRGVMLRGTVEVPEDPDAKRMIWRVGDRQYYSRGVTDPDFCVLKSTATQGSYYASYKSESLPIADPAV